MEYGFCTEFATILPETIDYALVEKIKAAGFDFVEYPLMLLDTLTKEQFTHLVYSMQEMDLKCTCCCKLFPKQIRVVGLDIDRQQIIQYLNHSFERAHQLGSQKIIFGSAPSRNLPEGYSRKRAYTQLQELIQEALIPLCQQYDMTLIIEPIRSNACNFINSLPEGMVLVEQVASSRVKLLADSLHMLMDSEDPAHVSQYIDSLEHVHIAEASRILPENGYSPEVEQILQHLRQNGYNKTISFESKAGTDSDSIQKALTLLKGYFTK